MAHQRLWLNHASPSVLMRQGSALAEQLYRSVERLDRMMILEMKTWAKPPQVVVTVFNMVTLGFHRGVPGCGGCLQNMSCDRWREYEDAMGAKD